MVCFSGRAQSQSPPAWAEDADPFAGRDTDQDGQLSLDEFLKQRPEKLHSRLKRDFHVVDWNADGRLSATEYQAIPGVIPGWRAAIPDPIRELAEEKLSTLSDAWNTWDANGDGSLDETEFADSGLPTLLTDLTTTTFPLWNRDDNDGITQSEAIEAIQRAYGLSDFGGLNLRPENGRVFNVMGFRYQDVDQDGFLGLADTQTRRNLDKQQAAQWISQYDQNQDGKLSPAESRPISSVDVFDAFLQSDANLDGQLSSDELIESAPDYQRQIAEFTFPGFDTNGDGQLSFREYRLTPLATYEEAWHAAHYALRDQDHDGQLAFDEFTWGRKLPGFAVRALLFERLDTSGDGHLDHREFLYKIDRSKVPPQVAFELRDANSDGELSLEEAQDELPDDQLARWKRDFQLVDWDDNQKLSPDEFATLSNLSSRDQRGTVPDPVLELAQQYLDRFEQNWEQWDADGDGGLSPAEFQTAALSASIPGLDRAQFADWDRDGQGAIEQQEAIQVVDATFGIRRLDGVKLRKLNGMIFSWMGFRWQDADGDGVIGLKDMQLRNKLDEAKAAERIAKYDQNQDGSLSAAEAWPINQIDVLQNFVNADKNLDGLLSEPEVLAAMPDYQQNVAAFVLPAFDADGNDQLNWTEYRLSLLANQHEAWHETRRDTNGDGQLSLEEFRWPRTVDAVGMVAFVFERLDTSGDGQLDLDEFPFTTSHRDPKRDFAAADQNKDGHLTLAELSASIPADQQPKLKRDFQVVDWNDDQRLSEDEYLALPGKVLAEQRTGVPDAIAEQAAAAAEQLQTAWAGWDQDANGSLDPAEFAQAEFSKLIPGLESAKFEHWNRDDNEKLTKDEALQSLNIAFGVENASGLRLRPESGLLFNSGGYRYQDADGDGFIGSKDMQIRRKLKPEQADQEIAKLDQDGDGKLSPEEAFPISRADVLSAYLSTDTDWNGLLSKEELLAATPSYQERLTAYIFDGFDADEDGQLNFREYRHHWLANFDESWHEAHYKLQDQDHDGLLSLAEFHYGRPFDSLAVRALLFGRLDTSGDGKLDSREFLYKIDRSKVPLQVAFKLRDANSDGELSLEEAQDELPDDQLARWKRDFQLVDWDDNQKLSPDEFATLSNLSSRDQRGTVPDPVLELAQQYLDRFEQNWEQWDADGDGGLSPAEFQTAALSASIPGLDRAQFADWDRDGQGAIEQQEAIQVVDATFGIRRLDGVKLRKLNGMIFSWMGFRWQDADGDGVIGLKDMQLRNKLDEAKAAERIAKYDQNQDGSLSAAEAWPINQIDVLQNFVNADKNLDGLLSEPEVLAAMPDYQQNVAAFVLPAFDADGNDQLNWTEYRLSLLANQHEAWHETRRDTNGDGQLSLEEFRWPRTVDAVGMVAFVFERLDTSGDGQLDLDEFPFTTSHRDPKRDFAAADTNEDEALTLDEFVSASNSEKDKRDFQVFDANADGRLSYEEFLSIPSKASAAQRIAPADPVFDLANELKDRLQQVFASSDRNQDGQLSADEFRNGRMTRNVPGLQLSRFDDWDRNRDEFVTLEEIHTIVDAAYGIKRLDGQPYRHSSGTVVNGMLYEHADENQDDRVSRDEYLARGFGGPNAAERFASADQDQDGVLTFTEWSQHPSWKIDPITEFLKLDADLSGDLSHEEVVSGTSEWQQLLASHYLPALDDNDDNALSLAEYRLGPITNLLTAWHNKKMDRDGDGHLSFGEFHEDERVELRALAREYFDRYDLDDNGKLSLQEFDFRIDPEKAPAEIAFGYYDVNQNHMLTLDEFLKDYAGRTDAGAQVVIGRLEEKFLAADANADKLLSAEEFRTSREDLNRKGRPQEKNSLSAKVKRNAAGDVIEEPQESNSRFWILVVINILLVGGVAWYVLFR